MIYSVILAGGYGKRFSSEISLPKQFAKINDKTILELSIDAFEKNTQTNKIIIVMNENFVDFTKELLSDKKYNKIIDIVVGGETRFSSSYFGLEAVKQDIEKNNQSKMINNVLIHDAARAFVSDEVINNVIDGLQRADGVEPVVPVSDTLVRLIDSKWVTQNRDDFATVQTPQGFNFPIIYNAYSSARKAPKSSWIPTDDISVLQEYGQNPKIISVSGDYHNKKITYFDDIG